MTPLAELFPDGDYRFQLTLRRGEPRDFFCTRSGGDRVLAERRRWLTAEPERYAALQPEGVEAFAEFAELCRTWGVTGAASVHSLGGALEPDFLLLSGAHDGFRLRGGALCFPTGWALEEKIGHPLDFIHGVVPGLNAALGSPIRQFLTKLKPGAGFLRDNWGIASSDQLNLHPARRIPTPSAPVELAGLWLRVEHQILAALPASGGVVFGIRIALHRLDEVAADRVAARGLARALETMPEPLLVYKRIEGIRAALVGLLG